MIKMDNFPGYIAQVHNGEFLTILVRNDNLVHNDIKRTLLGQHYQFVGWDRQPHFEGDISHKMLFRKRYIN